MNLALALVLHYDTEAVYQGGTSKSDRVVYRFCIGRLTDNLLWISKNFKDEVSCALPMLFHVREMRGKELVVVSDAIKIQCRPLSQDCSFFDGKSSQVIRPHDYKIPSEIHDSCLRARKLIVGDREVAEWFERNRFRDEDVGWDAVLRQLEELPLTPPQPSED